MRVVLLTLLAVLLTACAGSEAPVTDVNQPHLPPPDFPVSEAPDEDRICSGMVAGELAICAANEFCFIPEGQYCGAADYPGVCRPKPEICTQEYAPVCGCDGQTYSNSCTAHAAGVSVSTSGECS